MVQRKKTDVIQFNVRMTEELRKTLETLAKENRRSLNSEIVGRLAGSLGENVLKQIGRGSYAFLRLALEILTSPDEKGWAESPEQASAIRSLLESRLRAALEPVEADMPDVDERKLVEWLAVRSSKMLALGRAKEAQRLDRLKSMLGAIIEVEARQNPPQPQEP